MPLTLKTIHADMYCLILETCLAMHSLLMLDFRTKCHGWKPGSKISRELVCWAHQRNGGHASLVGLQPSCLRRRRPPNSSSAKGTSVFVPTGVPPKHRTLNEKQLELHFDLISSGTSSPSSVTHVCSYFLVMKSWKRWLRKQKWSCLFNEGTLRVRHHSSPTMAIVEIGSRLLSRK